MGVDTLEVCMVWVCRQEHFVCCVHEYYVQLLLGSSEEELRSYSKSADFSYKFLHVRVVVWVKHKMKVEKWFVVVASQTLH